MMRKWRTDLYRYGLRMTYDITIPTPGVRIWARWQRIAELDRKIGSPFVFERPDGSGLLHIGDISEKDKTNPLYWETLAERYQVRIDPPPVEKMDLPPISKLVTTGDMGREIFEFIAPPGYKLDPIVESEILYWGSPGTQPLMDITDRSWRDPGHSTQFTGSGSGDGGYHVNFETFGSDDKRTLLLIVGSGTTLMVTFKPTAQRTPEFFETWRFNTWKTLRDAALVIFTEKNALLQQERDNLWRLLASKDTLTLRRLEREEMVRLIMLWLLGPAVAFSNAPSSIEATLQQMLQNENKFLNGLSLPPSNSPTFSGLGPMEWSQALLFGDLVKFVQQAVEWENLVYFLYPYFWGSEQQGLDRLLFEHPDPEHQRFLRAGYARVVVTVRPGFEEDFTKLVETGALGGSYSSPYMTIAEEIANFAKTNYNGIPPANPEKHARPLLYPQQRGTWTTMQGVVTLIEQYYASNGKYPAKLTDLPSGTFVDAWGHDLVYKLPGSGNDYDLISYGADGKEGGEGVDADISAAAGASLIATWFDYTPTSGLDIEIDSKPEDIS
jgi:hypothetical protein